MTKNTAHVDGLTIGDNQPTRIMGILNLSPESFYPGSVVSKEGELIARAQAMVNEGMDILDIGGLSTAPSIFYDRQEVSHDVELERIEQGLELLLDEVEVPISVDTTSSKVAERALDLGASMINDVSGLTADNEMANVVAENRAAIVLMSSCAATCKSVEEAFDSLKRSLQIAVDSGIKPNRIIVDPGIGFGKLPEVDFGIVRELERFKDLNQPVLIGVSRKAFIGFLLGKREPTHRLTGSIAVTSVAVSNGANVVRTHDIEETMAACKIGRALRRTDPVC